MTGNPGAIHAIPSSNPIFVIGERTPDLKAWRRGGILERPWPSSLPDHASYIEDSNVLYR